MVEELRSELSGKQSTDVAGEGTNSTSSPQSVVVQSDPQDTFEFFGVGGEKMRAAGCDTVVDAKDLAVVGITEILNHLPKIWRLFHQLIEEDQVQSTLKEACDASKENDRCHMRRRRTECRV